MQLFSLPLGETLVCSAPLLVMLTIFFVILATNAVNFVDGLDGLATGIVGIAALSFFVYAYLIARSYSPPERLHLGRLHRCRPGRRVSGVHPTQLFIRRESSWGTAGHLLRLLLAAAMISITGTPTALRSRQPDGCALVLPLLVPISILLLPVLDVVLR